MPYYDKGKVRIYYEEAGSGFPLLVIPGGALNSGLVWRAKAEFDPFEEFQSEYRVIAMDLRNAAVGKSTGPLEVDRPWEAIAEDQLGLMDHLGIGRFLVMGFCIGNPMIWNLLQRGPGRIVAAVSAQPVGFRPENPDYSYKRDMGKWAQTLLANRPEISMDMIDRYLKNMYSPDRDFVFTATRDFVRNCTTPLLVMPDDTVGHPYAVAMEMVRLAPNAQVSLYPWRDTPQNTQLAVRHARTFLRAHARNAVAGS